MRRFLGILRVVGGLASLLNCAPIAASGNSVAPAVQAGSDDSGLRSIPRDKGLPVIVHVGIHYHSISALKENDSEFTGTVDVRLRWQDLRLRYDGADAPRGFKEYGGADADELLSIIWTPGTALDNMIDQPALRATNVRVFPDGWVEVIERTRARFRYESDASAFPFDTQVLRVKVLVRQKTIKEAALVFLQRDLDFSGVSDDLDIGGWNIGLVTLRRSLERGWYSALHSVVIGELHIRRRASEVITPIFIPLLASLLIPLLAIWMNGTRDGSFGEDAFEFGNILIGGLFAVIALNFSINSAYGVIASGDNVVTRLLGLNYVALAVSMLILLLLFRLNLPMRLFGREVQKAVFEYIYWAFPAVIAAIAIAFIAITWV